MTELTYEQPVYSEGGSPVRRAQDGMDPEVQTSRDLLHVAHSRQSVWEQEAIDDDAFRHGMQWTQAQLDELAARGQSPSVINMTYQTVETGKSLMTANPPKYRAAPREDADRQGAKMMEDILTWVWNINKGKYITKQILDDYYVKGRGVFSVYWDPFHDDGTGDVRIVKLYPFEVYPDPNSRDPHWDDAAYVIVSRLMTRAQVRDLFGPEIAQSLTGSEEDAASYLPQTAYASEEEIEIGPLEDQGMNSTPLYRFIDRYHPTTIIRYRAYGPEPNTERTMTREELERFLKLPVIRITKPKSGESFIETQPDKVAMFDALLEQYSPNGDPLLMHMMQDGNPMPGPGDHEQAVPDSEFIIQLQQMKDLLETGELQIDVIQQKRIRRILSVGDRLININVLPVSNYPIIPVTPLVGDNPYKPGDVRYIRGLQQRLNKTDSLLLAHLAASIGVKVWVPRGSINRADAEREMGKAGFGIIEYDANFGAPEGFQPIQLAGQIFAEQDRLKADIQSVVGVFGLSAGDPAAAQETFRGTVALDEMTTRRIKSKLDDIEAALVRVGEVVVQLVQAHYTQRKAIRIVEPSGEVRETLVNVLNYDSISGIIDKLNDPTLGRYDVSIVTGSVLPTSRWAILEYYLQFYDRGIIDQVEILKKSEIFDIEAILERTNAIVQLQQQVAQLTEALKQAQAETEAARQQAMNAKQQQELQRYVADLRTRKGNFQVQQQQLVNQLKTEIERQKMKTQQITSSNNA